MFVVLFVATSPLYYESAGVLAVASFVARVAASILSAFGIQATADANMMSTARGAFVVTQECISTPLIPVYCAGVAAYASTWPARAWGLLAAVPLFIGLGIARLLVVALPATLIGSPDFLIHAFYQLLLACVVVALAAFWRHGSAAATPRRAIAGMCAGTAFVYVFGAFYSTVVSRAAAMPAGLDDPQGAMAMLPSFQTGLYVALAAAAIPAAAWRPLLAGLALLVLSQVAFLSAVPFAEAQTGFALHVREVRAWALAGPILVIAVVNVYVRQRADRDGSRYRRFWAGVGERFPDLGLAASTRYYADNEQRLFTDHFPALAGLRILKTDLWDEAKNTRILAWASARGARAYGIDISAPTLTQARAAFHGDPLRCAVADVRHLPFQDGSFDAIYSMGTIEHFDETERAVREMARVLRPGGRAIVGVPNRHDPFLRPLFATLLQVTGLYAYGYEKSYSRRSLRQMLERAGLTVVEETAILFIPGWLRMLDLACHSWCRPMARFTGACVRPFVFLDRHVRAVRRHGYLLATVATKLEPPIGFVPSPARIRPFDV
jgi:SAM-dependent methyltransferase